MWLLSIPIDLKIRVDLEKKEKISLQIAWLYGQLKMQPEVSRATNLAPSSKPKNVRGRIVGVDRRGRRFVGAMFTSPDFLSRVLRFMVELLRAIEFGESALFVRLGLPDPADTGQAMGVLGPVLMCIPNTHIEPDFNNTCFMLRANGTVRVVPLRFLRIALLFGCAPELWRAVFSAMRATR